MNVAFPFRFDARGLTAEANDSDHIRELIEQVLFTAPGERVNRPDFGSGIMQLVFAPNSPELAAAAQFLVQSALQQWLADWIVAERVEVTSDDAVMRVVIEYVRLRTQQRHVAVFERPGAAP